MQAHAITPTGIERWLVSYVSTLRGIDGDSIDARERFSRYGVDSLAAIALMARLSEVVGRDLSPTLVWAHPTLEGLARHLERGADAPPDLGAERTADEPIAIIGMACRLPGAADPAAFWQMLAAGVDAIREVPEGRWRDDVRGARGADREERAKIRRGGYLERIDGFDPLFFGISPREAVSMDPQQRLMLELCWEALEDAGIRPSSLSGSRTGVFAGAIWSDYAMLLHRGNPEGIDQYTVTGYHHSIIANRASYFFGLRGPSFTVDSACSSGLVVTELACESLRRGDSELALVSAINLNVLPESALGVARFGALSPDGRCYTFDARANGYVRGEGGGVLVLKPLSRAIADGDPVVCVIRGTAVNNDGASNGLTAPNPMAQEAVLRAAYRRAGVAPADVQYVEAHGTGTALGDPIEACALGAVLGASRPEDAPLLVGSAKTNIGHLEGASGLVGLLKVALSIANRQVPPSLNFETPNPLAALTELHLAVPTSLRPWPAPERPLLAGVSAFGLGGTNGHVVLEEWPGARSEMLVISAEGPEALRLEVEARRAMLVADAARTPLATICGRAAADRPPGPERLAVQGRSHAEMAESLGGFLRGDRGVSCHVSHPAIDASRGVVFVFPGQGAQWQGMARSLLQGEPAFRVVIEECDAHIRGLLGWSLIDELVRPPASARFDEIEVSLPAIIAIDIAVAAWWRSLGIVPAAVVGHSTGEIAAAHVAGALSLEDTMKVICAYGRITARASGKGAMAIAGVRWADADGLLVGFEGRVFRAIQDSVETTVFAGEPAAVDELLAVLTGRGVFCRRVSMNVSPHCPRVDDLRADLFEAIQDIRPRRGDVPLISEVTGAEVLGSALDPAHWVRNFGEPALFSSAVDELIGRGHRVFLDVGPHPITKRSVEVNLERAGVPGVVLASLRRDEDARSVMLDALGALHALGSPVRLGALYASAAERGDEMRATGGTPQVLPLSARSPEALAALAGAYGTLLRGGLSAASLRDVAYTASVRRDHHAHRAAVVGGTREEVAEALAGLARDGVGAAGAGVVVGRAATSGGAGIVFVFPGQGSQWLGMGRSLLSTEPAFRAAMEACDEAIRREAGFSVLAEIAADESRSALGAISVVQPALFAMQVALAATWQAWGVEPDAVVGHSMGEVAAGHVAGALSLDDAARVICRRSRLLERASGKGAMALVELSRVDAERALAGYEHRLSVAVCNAPRSTVISGEPAAIDEVLLVLERRGVFCRRVKVDVASHSPQMDALTEDLLAALADLKPRAARIDMRSTVTGEPVLGPELDAAYWARNLREPVLFSAVTRALIDEGHGLFVEVSPHPILLPAIDDNLRDMKRAGAAVPSLRRNADERRSLLEALGALYVRGCDPTWKELFPGGARNVTLPTYRWQRDRYWIEPSEELLDGKARASFVTGGHPLLGAAFAPADRPEARYWQQRISAGSLPYLEHHRVRGEVVFPGAAFVEMALSAGASLHEGGAFAIESLCFERMLSLGDEGSEVQVALIRGEDGAARVEIVSRDDGGAPWVRHARAEVRPVSPPSDPRREPPLSIRERCPRVLEAAEHFARMRARGVDYGPSFQGLSRVHIGEHEVLGQAALPDACDGASAYLAHPALLDACFQVVMTLFGAAEPGATFVPVAIARLRLYRRLPLEVWVRATRSMLGGDGSTADLLVLDNGGEVVLEVEGLRVERLDDPARDDAFAGCAYTVAWEPREIRSAAPGTAPSEATWIVFADGGPIGAALAGRLASEGSACVEVAAGARFLRRSATAYTIDASRPADYERVIREVTSSGPPCRGIAHLWSLDSAPEDETTPDTLLADIRRGTLSALHLARTLARHAFRDVPRLLLVTRGAQAARGDGSPVSVAQAPLWGLARVIAMELPDIPCVRLDLDPSDEAEDVERIAAELSRGDEEDQVALRDGRRLVARLVRGELGAASPLNLREGGSFLITGGLGGLGLSVARWLVERGAQNLALMGRGAPSPHALQAIAALKGAGARVLVLRGDVARPDDVARVVASVHEGLAPLAGIVHAAGVLDDRTLLDMSEQQFWSPMSPKVVGAWNLHAATRRIPLDFFVLYSSAATLLGSPGQGNYAAANAFLDALAHHRVAIGLAATSVQWGLFSDVGLAAGEHRGQRMVNRGVASFTADEGNEILARLLARPRAELGVMRLDLRQWVEFYPRAADLPFFSALRAQQRRAEPPKVSEKFRDVVSALPPEERRSALERQVLQALEQALRLPANRIDLDAPFRVYGMDSLMSLEIRNRLEASLGLRLSAALLFKYPTTAALVDHLSVEIRIAPAPAGELTTAAFETPDAPATDAALSDDAALAMLDERLLDLDDYVK